MIQPPIFFFLCKLLRALFFFQKNHVELDCGPKNCAQNPPIFWPGRVRPMLITSTKILMSSRRQIDQIINPDFLYTMFVPRNLITISKRIIILFLYLTNPKVIRNVYYFKVILLPFILLYKINTTIKLYLYLNPSHLLQIQLDEPKDKLRYMD